MTPTDPSDRLLEVRRPEALLGDGVIGLRPLSHTDLADLEALGNDEEVTLNTPMDAPFTADDAVAWLARYITGWRDGSCAGFAVVDSDDGAFLGFCGLVRIDHVGREAEIGYMTVPAARGRGVGRRALESITSWAFETLGFERLELRVLHGNIASRRLAEHAGYLCEGRLRSVHFKHGHRTDVDIYARTGARGAISV